MNNLLHGKLPCYLRLFFFIVVLFRNFLISLMLKFFLVSHIDFYGSCYIAQRRFGKRFCYHKHEQAYTANPAPNGYKTCVCPLVSEIRIQLLVTPYDEMCHRHIILLLLFKYQLSTTQKIPSFTSQKVFFFSS